MRSDEALGAAIRTLTGDVGAFPVTHETRPLGEGFADAMAGGDGLLLHQGVVRTARGEQPFELVEKVCRVLPQGRVPESWLYWKREALAYGSGLLDNIPAGLRAPRCYGVAYTDAPAARIFIEAISAPQPDWDMNTHARAGEALGRFNGALLGMPDIEAHPWLAPGRAWSWTLEYRETLDGLAYMSGDPVVSRWLRGDSFDRTVALWMKRDVLRDALSDLPRCLCHHDAFKRNLMFAPNDSGGEDMIAIDWAFIGHGVLGEELAATIGAALMFRDVGADQAEALADCVFRAYLDGLRASGWSGSSRDVRLGFTATTALMFGVGALGPWLPLLRDPQFESVVQAITGVSSEALIDTLAAIQPFFLDLGDEALQLAGAA